MTFNRGPQQTEKPTTERFVGNIVALNRCVKHDVDYGEPCFWAEGLVTGKKVLGICNSRAKNAGFNGQIDPRSLTLRKGTGA